MKPYSESCDQNKYPILNVIQPIFLDKKRILEIGSGTGQHAVFFGEKMSHLFWQTSDKKENHKGINMWLKEAGLNNVLSPLALNTTNDTWPELEVDAVFSANTAHIMNQEETEAMFAGVGRLLNASGVFCLYGPFNYNGEFTSESNAAFDVWLKKQNPESGIKDFETLNQWANEKGMELEGDYEMPENNRILQWVKV